jgi:LysM repeat protein
MKPRRLPVRVFLILGLVALWILIVSLLSVHAAPPQQGGAIIHSVTRGQTLSGIAAQYGTSIGAIARANNIQNLNRIYVGQRLTIPASSAPVSSPVVAAPAPRSGTCTHQIVWGDTLSRIASRYGTTVGWLMSANGLPSTHIVAGRSLRVCGGAAPQISSPKPVAVPKQPSGAAAHRVQPGNTLSGIALLYHTSVQDVMAANGLTNPHHIYVGQSLTIPRQ